ncbi:uncharacterized protein FIBRA_08091 [Fibroporia radiculosa]|uniref:Amino acid permease/ SLC12A domain-containing protein n=1 Tax=Fibroporia radiculosa TaxID=599839 RepID=J4GW69_9APHY|nr:uncharacterized protein FIBRA_08091 [Fibroporia radiculosa]CCM05855.1 predicted protein [Fibroporia radiculosa]
MLSQLKSKFPSFGTTQNDTDDLNKAAVEERANDEKLPAKLGSETSSVGEEEFEDPNLAPSGLNYEEVTAGGMGRHLGVFTCTLMIVGRVIGTGIFSTPSSILGSVGSVGASMMLWVLGFVLSFCGLFIWLEFGTMIPRSGGEKVYLEAVYTKPRYLATIVFAANAILLGFTAAGCIVFAENILVSAGVEATQWNERGIALGVIFFVTFLHGFTPRLGIFIMNILSVFKIVILLFVVITGWVVLSGRAHIQDPHANFRDAFAGSSHSSYDYATATFKVLNAYTGWSAVNYVMNNVKDPVRTLKIAGPLGLGICAVLYMLANVAYFAAATKEEIENTGVTVASLFFYNVFGETAQRALTVFVALSALGYIIIILGPPPSVAYPFILDVEGYPGQIINFFIVIGLFWFRWRKPNIPRPFKVWWPIALFYLAAAVFLLVAPFLRPPGGIGDTPPLPYYLYCLVGIAIMLAGVVYWAAWRILPRLFGYEYIGRKETLADGTVVALFSAQKIQKGEVDS